MPKFISWAKKKASQPIYELAPQAHQAKAGTPTMGGVVFYIFTIIATILTAKLNNFYIVGGLLTLALFSLIGIKDDLSKILKAKIVQGLVQEWNFFLQFISAGFVVALLFYLGHRAICIYHFTNFLYLKWEF